MSATRAVSPACDVNGRFQLPRRMEQEEQEEQEKERNTER
jgi:hypothetical protein